MKLFVANIPYESTEDDIQDLFSNHGDVVDFYMPRDRDSGNYKGFAFVTYSSESEARDAIEAINGQEFNGRNLHVDEAKEKKNYKKKDRIESSGDKDRIKLMKSNLTRYTEGGMCRGAGAAIRGTKFKGVF